MTSSVNGSKFATPQWGRNDEVDSCTPPEGAPPEKTFARPATFCKDVTIQGNLVVEGNVTISGTLTVGGTVTAPFFDGIAAEAITLA